MNCASVVPDDNHKTGECPPNCMLVNARMCCEEWKERPAAKDNAKT